MRSVLLENRPVKAPKEAFAGKKEDVDLIVCHHLLMSHFRYLR